MNEGKDGHSRATSSGTGGADEVASLDTSQDDQLDPAVRDVLIKRAEAEALQWQLDHVAAITKILDEEEEEQRQEEAPKKLPANKTPQTSSTALTNSSNAKTQLTANQEKQQQATEETNQAVSKEVKENGFKVGAGRSLTVAEQGLSRRTTSESREEDKMGKFANAANVNAAANANTNEDVPFNAQEAALVSEQQDSVPGTTVEDPAPVSIEVVPQNGLYRSTQMRPQSQPGAFLGAPGGQMQRNPNVNYGLLGANSGTHSGPEDSSVGTGTPARMLTNEGLVKANAIEDDTADLMHADPVDLEAAHHRVLQKKEQQRNFFAAVLWLFLVAAIIVGFVVGTQKKKEADVVVLESTEAPTVYGSMTPSEVPSSAPTGALDLLFDSLPDYTLASMNNGSGTPQWRAWRWLAEHQNITFLPEWRKTQLLALATFFYAFEGESWNPSIKGHGWMDDTVKECDWFSSGLGYFFGGKYLPYSDPDFSCNDHRQVTSLDLQDLQLSGLSPHFPPEIALLTSLSIIAFWSNDITTPVSSLLPTELYEMSELTSLTLTGIQSTGKIPSEISALTSLSVLDLGASQLSGQIPSELWLLTSLDAFDLWNNQLTGPFPSELGLLTSLANRLSLSSNQFTGPVPSELGAFTALRMMWLNDNQLFGPVPSELGKLAALKWISLNQNQLTGQVPSQLGLLTALTTLRFNENHFTGTIPSELGLMASLKELQIQQNRLTGPISSDIGQLTALLWLHLYDNQLTGPVPSELGQLTALRQLQLSDNHVSGQIPTEIGMMTSLTSLALENNNLVGTLPIQLNASMGLRLYGNQFSGTVPGHLCSLLWCDCSQNETPPVSTCADLKEAPPDWPGRIPTRGAEVMLNIHTDYFPRETSWVWQKGNNVTGNWTTLESGGPLEFKNYLYSSLFPVNTDEAYRLILSDSWNNGIFSSGWITVTATDQTVLYSFVDGEAFADITVDVLVGADGSFDISNSTTTGPYMSIFFW